MNSRQTLLAIIALSLASSLQAQYVYTIKADSVKITNCDSAELIIENHTQNVPGFLFNTGNGRTIFKKVLQSLSDSQYILGTDTLNIPRPVPPAAYDGLSIAGTSVVLGQEYQQPGNPAELVDSREIPLNSNAVFFTDSATSTSVAVGPANLYVQGYDGTGNAGSIVLQDVRAVPGGLEAGKSFSIIQKDTVTVVDINNAGWMQFYDNSADVRFGGGFEDPDAGQTVQVIGNQLISQTLISIGSPPALEVDGNWNQGPNYNPTLILGNLVADESGSNSKLIDLQTGGVSQFNIFSHTGYVGVGTAAPTAQLHTTGTVRFAGLTGDNSQSRVIVSDANGNLFYRDASTLADIGPSRGSLAIHGTIQAKKLILSPDGWADYVFDSSYQLPSLTEVEAYIHREHHLPGIPSAAQVKKDSLDIGAGQTALLKKIEELTLYNIDQQKKIEEQNLRLDEQEKRLAILAATIEELKKQQRP
jgi:hypothetical protein